MAPSKLSPSERAFRKREAARLRQQRCRERKRQANLIKKLEEQKKVAAAEMKNNDAGQTSPVSKIVHHVENNQVVEPPLPPLMQRPQPKIRSYSAMSQPGIDPCESFPSLKSESSMMTADSMSHEDYQVPIRGTPSRSSSFGPKIVSPNCVLTDLHGVTQYACRKDHYLPASPPVISVKKNVVESGQSGRAVRPLQMKRQSPKSSLDHEIEFEAVRAMLSLKTDAPRNNDYHYSRAAPRRPPPPPHHPTHLTRQRVSSNYTYDQGFEQGYKQCLQQSTYRSLSNPPPPPRHHGEERIQYDRRMSRSEAMMHARDNLRPGMHYYY